MTARPRLQFDANQEHQLQAVSSVARVHRDGQVEVRAYVHETKGTTELGRLQFPHERRKIRCAERYFAAIGVAYRTVDPQQRGHWWEVGAGQQRLGV